MNSGATEETMMTNDAPAMERVRAATVMVVHESSEQRAVIRRAVERAGVHARLVLEAANGYEALALVAAVKVDLALVASEMRLMGSVELMARIRDGARRSTAFVLLVDDQASVRVAASYCTGACAQLVMPLVPDELRRVVVEVLGQGK